ncbi:fimbrial protein [Enterobacteriaceae bacterium ESL0689]|nr:fimbrial protein [Enterobacteriaceae bacterium ESL0689]
MRKLLCLPCILLTLVATHTIAAESTITLNGYMHDNSCEVDSQSVNFGVDLLHHATKQLNIVGATTVMVPFKIVFSSCGASTTNVRIGFTGTADGDDPHLLKNDGSASGLGVEILDSDKNIQPLNALQTSIRWTPLRPGQSNIVNFYARLKASRSPVVAGIVQATATFTLEFQ